MLSTSWVISCAAVENQVWAVTDALVIHLNGAQQWCCLSLIFSTDFLQDIMKLQDAPQALSWLGPIIQNDPLTLDALPVSVLCELLLVAQADKSPYQDIMLNVKTLATDGESSFACCQAVKRLSVYLDLWHVHIHANQIPRLLTRLLQYFKASTPTPTEDILKFFLERLSMGYVGPPLDFAHLRDSSRC